MSTFGVSLFLQSLREQVGVTEKMVAGFQPVRQKNRHSEMCDSVSGFINVCIYLIFQGNSRFIVLVLI